MDRRTVVSVVSVVFLAMLTCGAHFAWAGDCGEPVPPPKYTVGDKWVSRDEKGREISQEVVGFDGDLAQIRWTDARWEPDGKGIILIDAGWVIRKAIRPNGEIVTSQGRGRPFELVGQGELDFPLVVGKTWSFGYMSYGTGELARQNFKVVVCEDVATSAGKLPALRVEREIRFQRGSSLLFLWYSPTVKNFVKWQFPQGAGGTSLDSELIRYELK